MGMTHSRHALTFPTVRDPGRDHPSGKGERGGRPGGRRRECIIFMTLFHELSR